MSGNRSIRHRISKLAGLEILKNVILVVHFIGLRHPIGSEVNDTKITVKLLALVAIESWGQKIEDLGIEEAHRRAPLVQGMIGAGMELIAHGVDEHTAAADVYRILVDGLKA